MLTHVNPKLPMIDQTKTKEYYLRLGFHQVSEVDFEGYLMMGKDEIELHFFEFKNLNAAENYGQVYLRTNAIEELYQNFIKSGIEIHPNGHLEAKPWGQKEFAMLDPDNNLLTFGQSL